MPMPIPVATTDRMLGAAAATARTPDPLPPHPWILRPATFARGWAVVLAGLVLLGISLEFARSPRLVPGFLEFDWTHDLLHVVLLGLAVHFGWLAQPKATRTYARVFGIGGLFVAAVGFFPPSAAALHDLTGWHSELGENVVHGALGAWGLVAGFLRTPRPA